MVSSLQVCCYVVNVVKSLQKQTNLCGYDVALSDY